MTIELDQILNSTTTEIEIDIATQLYVVDKEFSIKFNAAGGDTPSVTLYRELVAESGYVPVVKSPFDLTQASFNADCGGIGFNDLARVGKIKFTLVGAVNPATTARIIFAS